MQEKPSPISRDTQETYPDWSTLVGQAVDDVSRILHSETQLLQINLSSALVLCPINNFTKVAEAWRRLNRQ
jgi:hypothetical protein